MSSHEKYSKLLRDACNEMRLDYFPQVEASELLYRVITLEDIYLPLYLDYYLDPLTWINVSEEDEEELFHIFEDKMDAWDSEESKINSICAKDYIEQKKTPLEEFMYRKSGTSKVGHRVLIEAMPGGGKTTFCKRLVLALLNNDADFFRNSSEEKSFYLDQGTLPVYISCKNIIDLSDNDLSTLDFQQLLYRLCLHNYGERFFEISEAEFFELVDSDGVNKVCLIFDGWDEILDSKKEKAFSFKFDNYLKQNPHYDAIITIRPSYSAPKLSQPYSATYTIRPLSDNDIREFCKKWCEVILNPNQQIAKNYSLIAEQILSSKNQQIRAMMRNPLDLSLLLTVSKNDGRLPENKAELFRQLVDLYIFWNTKKSAESLSAKTIRVFLAYIASVFTKNGIFYCDENEVLRLVDQAKKDLDWCFSEDISRFDHYDITKELTHTGILTRAFDGKRFTFSESRTLMHRQMQEYLTAFAILAQYSDDEYNNMPPIEILEDKYDISEWREVILFISLMDNGRLRHEIINRLLFKSKEKSDNKYIYTQLLFDFVVNGADIRSDDKNSIFDAIFSEQITDQLIEDIVQLITTNSRNAAYFISYIDSRFKDSVYEGNSEYGYAKAVIESCYAIQDGESPFSHAEVLMRSNNKADVIAGSQILTILAWCKYANIYNSFSSYYEHYTMPATWISLYKELLKEQDSKSILLKSIRDAILADFASFNSFFDDDEIITACSDISDPEKTAYCEIVLSIAPIMDPSFPQLPEIDNTIKARYLSKLDNEKKNNEYDVIAFTFSICVSLDCYTLIEQENEWEKIDEIYRYLYDDGYIGKARYLQLKKNKKPKSLPILLEELASIREYSPSTGEIRFTLPRWELKEHRDSCFIYSSGKVELIIKYPENELTADVLEFLSDDLPMSIETNNNLSYLLRRHELETITIGSDPVFYASPEQLLKNGIYENNEFSIINYALSISNTYVNNKGEYNIGKDYLLSIKGTLHVDFQHWIPIVDWWQDLLLVHNEYEGLVVLSWLFFLGLLEINYIDHQIITAIENIISTKENIIEDFLLFREALTRGTD